MSKYALEAERTDYCSLSWGECVIVPPQSYRFMSHEKATYHLNLVKGLGPAFRIVESWTINLLENVKSALA